MFNNCLLLCKSYKTRSVVVIGCLTITAYFLVCKKKKPVDFDDELKIGDVRYDNMTKITIKVQLF